MQEHSDISDHPAALPDLTIRAKRAPALVPYSVDCLKALPRVGIAARGDAIAAMIRVEGHEELDASYFEWAAPSFLAENSDGDIWVQKLDELPSHCTGPAAVAYVAIRSDAYLSNWLDRRMRSKHRKDSTNEYDLICLRGAVILCKSSYFSWPSEQQTQAHIPAILKDVEVVFLPDQSNHSLIEATEDTSVFLTRWLRRALFPKLSPERYAAEIKISLEA